MELWAFCVRLPSAAKVRDMTKLLIQNASKNVKSGGIIILLETLGTNVETPGAPSDRLKTFYTALEQEHGFTLNRIRTYYQFPSTDEAARIMGFF